MGDYGFRISVAGQDVKTCSDLNTIVNSKYSLLKSAITGSGTIDISDLNLHTITIAHSLGYIPFARVFIMPEYYPTPGDGDHPEWAIMPINISISDGSTSYTLEGYCYTDATNLYILLQVTDSDWTHDPKTITYKYHIFYDKGKL